MNLKSTFINFLLASGLGVTAQAAPVTYTFSGTAGGTVNGTPFTAAAFTIRVFADTVSIRPGPPNFFQVDDLFSTLDLAGFASATFIRNERVFVNQSLSVLGFSHAESSGARDLLDINGAPFATYNLASSLGPIFDATPFAFEQLSNEPSSLGPITFTQASNVTFTASVIPEPASLALLLLGLSVAAGARLRNPGLRSSPVLPYTTR